ncbi:unnamed protein product [Zymoseptoria tritici ST99CH_3D7]|uniref:Holocytochrome c-type synthase n=1 Tax=Zymoseptoria tritici (strain ST99CH_3D7) TaxID=1276538 RepID=A0A1X7S753_ZYMT9|nr:unnamed protein product [Zymoseptoria tritici ST99CH_3D7]
MRPEDSSEAEKCPVDPKTREIWLEAARAKGSSETPPTHPPPPPTPPKTRPSSLPPARWSLDTSSWQPLSTRAPPPKPSTRKTLPTDREISTIPRAITDPSTLNSAERAALPPSNSESDTGHDASTGNWVYPSQSQFFSAMQRKGHEADPSDMSSVVPIHNAVNERAWSEIKKWEAGWGSEKCGGPKLVSFAGDSKKLTPRARWNGLLGYSEPFDRHDWVVDRCGKKVEYVIDFYKGKGGAGPLSFYLDVRPKLNSWEGWKMRGMKGVGLA